VKVLLVEPDRMLADIYLEALADSGFDVMYAPNAQGGIIVADAVKPDLIILELQLVEHSGIEFLYELRSYGDWQHIPVIINSIVPPAEFNGSHNLLKKELGVTNYLYKPDSSLKELVSLVKQVDLNPA
jgi:DNA-binding response OmpR family regulator